jgi:hypothetical protein
MLSLIEFTRQQIARGASLSAIFIDRPQAGRDRDRVMAERILAENSEKPGALILSLVGNLHARITPERQWMGTRLLRANPGKVMSLNLRHSGGSAWLCMSGAPCGPQKLRGRGDGDSLRIELSEEAQPHYNGWYSVGKISASPRAAKREPC